MCGPAEDFETIARHYATVPRNQRTFSNWLREFTQFIIAPLSPGFDLDRYDRELRRPFPSKPQFAPDSKVWRREHGITDSTKAARQSRRRPLLPPAALNGWNLNRRRLCKRNSLFSSASHSA